MSIPFFDNMRRHILDNIKGWKGRISDTGDGISLTSVAHPIGGGRRRRKQLSGIETVEIELRTYARSGEVVTCENGHQVCEFACDVATGETFKPEHLTNWKQPEPKLGGRIPLCKVCGGLFYLKGNIFHVGTKWRDPDGLIQKHGLLS